MKQSHWAKSATVVQALQAVLCLGVAVYLYALMFSAEISRAPDAGETIHGLKIAAGVLFVPGIVLLVAAFGLWGENLWGWWLAFLGDFGWASLLLYSMIDDGWANLDGSLLAVFAVSVIPVAILLLPSVRRNYWRKPSLPPATPIGSATGIC
jgi:hypothetical protein